MTTFLFVLIPLESVHVVLCHAKRTFFLANCCGTRHFKIVFDIFAPPFPLHNALVKYPLQNRVIHEIALV